MEREPSHPPVWMPPHISEIGTMDVEVPRGWISIVEESERLRAENERLRAERLKLDRRIHNQRRALRENWEIVEMRQNCIGSAAARRTVALYIRLLRETRAEIEKLRAYGQTTD